MLPNRKKAFSRPCLVAIGANLPGCDGAPALEICERAIRAICTTLPDAARPVRSRWYSTAPIPPSGQPRYINGMLQFWTAATATELLATLQAIEHHQGRTRSEPNAPRTLDLDIVDMEGEIRNAPDPILPHPRAHLRAFVLLPLRDLAPGWTHPISGLALRALIGALPDQDVRTLGS